MTSLLYPICFHLLIWSDHFPGYDAGPIQGGQHDRDNEVIWQVSYQKKGIDDTWHHICGGSIISTRLIVTAAHCFVQLHENGTKVWDRTRNNRLVIGTNDLHSHANPGVELKIGKVIVPKAYTRLGGKRLLADIAVIRLKHHIDLSINRDKYGPIDLFDPKDEIERKKYDDQEGFVAGFGATKMTYGPDGNRICEYDGLRNILPVHLTDVRCPKLHGLRCVRYERSAEEPKGVCFGDSGGPLYYRNGNKFELVGVISTGPRNSDIRASSGTVEKVMFIPDYTTFLKKASTLCVSTTFPGMSVEDFEKSGVDYVVLPDQAELASKYYVQPIEKKKGKEATSSQKSECM